MHREFFTIQALLTYTQYNHTAILKGFYRLGLATSLLAQVISGVLGVDNQKFEIIIDSDSIRHTLKQHGLARNNLEAARGQIPIIEEDLLALPDWLLQAQTVWLGQIKPGKQPRIELEQVEATGTTVVILEWRPGRQQLALVTMYKKRPVA